MADNNIVIGVIGLGYVGIPLAVEFGKKFRTIGFDLKKELVESYRNHHDPMGEVSSEQLKSSVYSEYTYDPSELSKADFLIVAVPTPVNEAHQPDLLPLISASETIGKNIKKGAIVIFESTVYPGATEEECVPVIEKFSGLKWKKDFFVSYSPERINPGDKERTLTTIVKVISGDTPETLEKVKKLYESIITAGVFPTKTIKEAEAAKVIENTQRDLNIALINELAVIFDKLGIDTINVLEAAGSKWNFLPFRPGLVGGHCIGVDPYYLTYKAETVGYHPQVILAGRRINDSMGKFIAEKTVKRMIAQGINIKNARVTVMGLTFKEDCPDLRNSKVVDIINELESYGIKVQVHDPISDQVEAEHYYGVKLTAWENLEKADAMVFAVAHRPYKEMQTETMKEKVAENGVIIDVKSIFNQEKIERAGLDFWRL
ncbi:nucleotide sugar dehydrogenase [Desulforegula conservatrix]|uniref:nucleotide sugar dehydrogenase n=1 Tax=Desulforegula conservatrix TaxID=153026 RepID=UPI0003FFC434|nr:nucleotide sugar dehydrogenase [Desulforegula conservatrix]